MRRLTSGWTSSHARVAVAYTAGVVGCLAGLTESGSLRFWIVAAVAIAVLAALPLDGFGGVIVGLGVAAALIGVRRATGHWDEGVFWASLVESLAIVIAGTASGWAGAGLRTAALRDGEDAPAAGAPAPVFGSLGLLAYDVALLRLEEEVDRSRPYRRPLSVLVMDVDVDAAAIDPAERGGALRAVARVLQARLDARDVPFAISPERLGAIMPETAIAGAWERVGAIVDGVAETTFMSRTSDARQPLSEVLRVHAGIAELSPGATTAEELLDAATAGIRRGALSQDPGAR